VAQFLARLPRECPPHAQIHSLETAWLPVQGNARFEIRHSDDRGAKTTLVLPDLATCPDCLADVLDAANRRHGYPFANCTNCGPRFTIVQALPYDRPNTTMAHFALCPDCLAEYTNPLDRRFHAQPTACATCGPQLALYAPAAPGCIGATHSRRTLAGADRRLGAGGRCRRRVGWRSRGAGRRADRGGEGAGRLSPDGGRDKRSLRWRGCATASSAAPSRWP
jgi:hypothetical protein